MRGLIVVLIAGGLAEAADVSPVEKVIELMEGLTEKISEEGKNEAAQYDKFACFCKDNAASKTKSIAVAKEKEEILKADIDDLQAQIADLEAEIEDLIKKIKELTDEIAKITKEREATHKRYVEEEADVSGAISACSGAIDAINTAKGSIAANGGKVDLMQVLGKARAALGAGLRSKAVEAALTAREPGVSAGYETQSNGILDTIKDLLTQFKEDKAHLDKEEHDSASAFNMKKASLSGEMALAEFDKSAKEEEKESKSEELKKTEAELAATEESRKADEDFLEKLEKSCTKKAEAWDKRSSTRAAELAAVSEALAIIKTGAQSNENQDKLAALQKAGPVSFLQLGATGAQGLARRVEEKLRSAAVRLGSINLAGVAMELTSGKGVFDKVTGMIEDLIKKLEDQAAEEEEKKGWCDKEIADAKKQRDTAKDDIKEMTAKSTEAMMERAKDLEEVDKLSANIADLKKAVLQATDLRASEKAANEKTLADAKAGKTAVEKALKILQEFYGLVQTQKQKDPTDGKGESKGIIGLLEVILSDFDRTVSNTKQGEAEALEDFKDFKGDSEKDIDEQSKSRADELKAIADLESDLVEYEDKLRDANKSLKSALEELDELKVECDIGAVSYEETKARREQEIEALKEALQMLDSYKGSGASAISQGGSSGFGGSGH